MENAAFKYMSEVNFIMWAEINKEMFLAVHSISRVLMKHSTVIFSSCQILFGFVGDKFE